MNMLLTWLKAPATMEAELTASFRPHTNLAVSVFAALTFLLLYVFVQRANTKEVSVQPLNQLSMADVILKG